MNFDSLLIVTYGRSGSTLLQGVLNSIPGVLVRGENHNLCHGLYRSYRALSESKRQFGGDFSRKVEHPWYGSALLDADRFLADARTLVMNQLLQGPEAQGARCVGFKEIRYTAGNLDGDADEDYTTRLHGYLDFLAQLFPKLGIVILTRPHDQVANSFWWKRYAPEHVDKLLTDFETNALAWKSEQARSYRIDYTDVTGQTSRLAGLFDFIGARYSPDEVAQVLAREHSAENRPETLGQMRNYELTVADKGEAVSTLYLDDLPLQLQGEDRFRLSGVCRLAGDPTDVELLIRDGAGRVEKVKAGLPSPHYASRFPGDSAAAHARFRGPELSFAKSPVWELCLARGGQTRVLARVASRA